MSNLSKQDHLLLQKALFNELDAAEQKKLDALLARSPEANTLLNGLRNTISLAAKTPQEPAPGALEERILASLPKTPHKLKDASALAARCPYYFFIAGALHVLLGTALQTMLSPQHIAHDLPQWIMLQPDFCFATGFFFMVCGGLLHLHVSHAARIGLTGLACYVGLVAINGVALLVSFNSLRFIFGLLAFVGMGLTISLLLGAMLQQYSEDVLHG